MVILGQGSVFMSFLPISIIAYVLNGGAILVDKILLKKSFPDPVVYTFFVNLLQLLVLFLIPFGFKPTFNTPALLATASGIVSVAALYTFFMSLKKNEASIVGPIVGAFNPLFALILGGLFLNQILTQTQYLAFFVLILGATVLTFNLWISKIEFNNKFLWMLLSGFLFALSYLLLREAFLGTTFLNGFIISRASAGILVLFFLLSGSLRKQIFLFKQNGQGSNTKTALALLISGQTMGAFSSTLIIFGVSLASPALVNSLFGVQYLVILIAALILAKREPQLLGEHLSKPVITQKITGALILSLGLYLLTK